MRALFQHRTTAHWLRHGLIAAVLVALVALYAATLQTHISGSFPETSRATILKNEYIKDVAEIQVALNIWGTIHHTGYPLFAILGNLFTAPLRVLGVSPATAASLYATAWGVVLLAGFGALIGRLTGHALLAAVGIAVLGLARSLWLHHVIAEVYSMSLALIMLMLLVALWRGMQDSRQGWRRRVLALALLGGIGVAHHRAVAFAAPGLLLAVWPYLRQYPGDWRRILPPGFALALLGFLPYLYLPLRAWQGAAWVYGEPGTLRGLWIEFSGQEADRLVTLPRDLPELRDNAISVWDILVHELTLPGLLAALVGVLIATTVTSQRRAARVVVLTATVPALFAVFYHTAVLPQAILMPVVLALVFCTALSVDWLANWDRAAHTGGLIALALWAVALAAFNYNPLRELVTEPSGLNVIARMDAIPREGQPAFMLPWGPRHAAAAYAARVTGEHASVRVVDHKADFRALLADGYQLYTEPETFYTYPPPWGTPYAPASTWWTDHVGTLYLRSAAPQIVQLMNVPELAASGALSGTRLLDGIERRSAWLTCDAAHIFLHVIWGADTRPDRDPSIFVHLTGDTPAPDPPNADRRHPVYGLYPFAQWSPGEIVRDDYVLPRLPDKTQVRFGLYEQDATGQFTNYGAITLPVAECEPIRDRRPE